MRLRQLRLPVQLLGARVLRLQPLRRRLLQLLRALARRLLALLGLGGAPLRRLRVGARGGELRVQPALLLRRLALGRLEPPAQPRRLRLLRREGLARLVRVRVRA